MKTNRAAWPLFAVLAFALAVFTADSAMAGKHPSTQGCESAAIEHQTCQGADAPPAKCEKQASGSVSTASKEACAAKCAKAPGAVCASAAAAECGKPCAGMPASDVKCTQTCASRSCAGCKCSCQTVCGPRWRGMHHAANRCGCGKVSCQLYGIGCGHARHAMMDGRHDRMTCRQPCCAMPGMNMKMMRSGAATCEPGPRMPCCAMPEGAVKKVKKMWIEKQGQAGMKAGGHEMMKRSRRMEGTDGKKIYVIKTDPDQEHVWVESEAHARWKDQDRRVKKIRIRKPGNAKIEEIVIDDDEDEDDEAWSDDRGDEDVRIMRSGGQEIAWLGVELQDLTPELRDAFDIPAGVDGALITDVVRSGPARKWGFRRGFVVTDFNGTPIHSAEDLVEAVKASEPGDLVTVLMNRKGSTITRRVELGSRQAPVEMQRKFDIRTPDIDIEMPQMEEMGDVEHMMRSGAFLGVSAETPTDKDRQKLNAPEDMGVLITEVQENSAAEQAGLKKGDLLVKVDGDDIEDPEDLVEAITSREPGDVVTLYYMRDGEKMKADAKLGKRQLPESLRLMGRKVGSADRMEMRRYELKRELMRLHQQLQNLQDELDELNERTETQED